MGAGRPKSKQTETHKEALSRLGIVELTDNYGHVTYRTANREAHTAPKIKRKYKQGGVRMYECEGNRHFIAAKYDEMFKPAVKNRHVKNKAFKGDDSFFRR